MSKFYEYFLLIGLLLFLFLQVDLDLRRKQWKNLANAAILGFLDIM
jgi:hypothetical protein